MQVLPDRLRSTEHDTQIDGEPTPGSRTWRINLSIVGVQQRRTNAVFAHHLGSACSASEYARSVRSAPSPWNQPGIRISIRPASQAQSAGDHKTSPGCGRKCHRIPIRAYGPASTGGLARLLPWAIQVVPEVKLMKAGVSGVGDSVSNAFEARSCLSPVARAARLEAPSIRNTCSRVGARSRISTTLWIVRADRRRAPSARHV